MPEAKSLRFAVLHHTGVAEPHYDLLIEISPDAPLRTWRCGTWPLVNAAILNALPDHRHVYLEYEGAVPGGRGEVARIDEGSCTIQLDTATELRIRLTGRSSSLSLHLAVLSNDRWAAAVGS